MTDAEIIRACAARFTVWHAPAHVIVNDLLRIADRLEKIDAQEALKSGQDVPKVFIPLHYAKACADAGVPITWVVGEEKPT